MGIFYIDGFDAYTDAGNAQTGLATRWSSDWWIELRDGSLHGGAGKHVWLSAEPGHGRIMRAFDTLGACSFGFTFHTSNVIQAEGDNALAMLGAMGGDAFDENAHGQVKVCITSLGAIRIMRGASAFSGGAMLAESSAGVVINNLVQNIEVEAIIGASGRVTVWIDGIQVATFSGNTQQQVGIAGTDVIRLGGGTYHEGNAIKVDDFWISNSATKPAGGPFRVSLLRPAADGATTDFNPSTGSANYALVDDAQVSLGDYVTSDVAGAVDEYHLEDMAEVPDAIAAVQAVAFARKTDAGVRTFAIGVKSGGTVEDGPVYGLLTSATKLVHVLEEDPATGAPWTFEGINALQLRPKIVE